MAEATDDMYVGIPVRRGRYGCDDWQRMAEDLKARGMCWVRLIS